MDQLEGRVAVITGAASGIGAAMARRFAAEGMGLVLADVEEPPLDALVTELSAAGAEVIGVPTDVSDAGSMDHLGQAALARFERVNVVCNNAGVSGSSAPVHELTAADWDWVLGVNLHGVVNGVQTFTRRIEAHGEGGHFVNTASMAGHLALPGMGVYATTKFAVVGLSEAMRGDLAAKNIGVSVLCPGVVRTNIFDSGRNRPVTLRGERDTAALLLPGDDSDPERAARLEAVLAAALDPAVVGDMVLHAIQNDELYVFTHPEMAAYSEARWNEMNSAFQRWHEWRQQHGV